MTQRFQLAMMVVLLCYVVMSNQEGTTPNLQEIFTRRCQRYSIRPAVNCDDLWSYFSSPWIYRSPCVGSVPDYGRLFRSLTERIPKDKALFWSGTKDFAHQLSKNRKRYITLEDTLIGSVADGLTWCGQTSVPGINYVTCPAYGTCGEPKKQFWVAASRWFASQAAGEVSVVLNGSDPGPNRPAYRRDSIFGDQEVPMLQKNSVTKLTAIVVHDVGKPEEEFCTSKSLLELKEDIEEKNIKFDCVHMNKAVTLGLADLWAPLPVITTMAISLMINFR